MTPYGWNELHIVFGMYKPDVLAFVGSLNTCNSVVDLDLDGYPARFGPSKTDFQLVVRMVQAHRYYIGGAVGTCPLSGPCASVARPRDCAVLSPGLDLPRGSKPTAGAEGLQT